MVEGKAYAAHAYCLQLRDFGMHCNGPQNSNHVLLYKLHGGYGLAERNLPEESNAGRRHWNAISFDDWFNHGAPWFQSLNRANDAAGPRSVVASYDDYLTAAEGYTQTTVAKHLLKELRGRTIVLMGLGLGSHEPIVHKLLVEAEPRHVLAYTVDAVIDPLWKYELRSNWHALRIPLGLVSSPQSRILALLVFLQKLIDNACRHGIRIHDLLQECSQSTISLDGKPFNEAAPLIVAPGQASVNRVLGLSNAVAQERAYAPEGSKTSPAWSAEKAELTQELGKPLSNIEVGGQSLIPCRVWESIGLPCALAARIGTDEYGERIVRALQKLKWVDFEWVMENQLIQQPHNNLPLTENATIITWFGLRTLLDQGRQFSGNLRLPEKQQQQNNTVLSNGLLNPISDRSLERRYGWSDVPILYLTKVMHKEVIENIWRSNQEKEWPLIIYDTGGRGMVSAELSVANHNGIIIASAYSALEWLNCKPLSGGCEGMTEAELIDSLERNQTQWRAGNTEPSDSRGRVWQSYVLLSALKDLNGNVPWFLKDEQPLFHLRAYVITLGELGCVYWVRDGDWKNGRWCRLSESMRVGKKRRNVTEEELKQQMEKYKQVVSALECGDVARAGFAASLLASMAWQRNEPSASQIEYAVGWANWFGAMKLRYFAIDDYCAFLSRCNPSPDALALGCKRVSDAETEMEIGFEKGPRLNMKVSPVSGPSGGVVEEAEEWREWLGQYLYPCEKRGQGNCAAQRESEYSPSELWNIETQLWQEARGFKECLQIIKLGKDNE